MKKWNVDLPITGYFTVEGVEAETEEDAIEAAMEADYDIDNMTEWEVAEHAARGTVNYAVLRHGSAEEWVEVEESTAASVAE